MATFIEPSPNEHLYQQGPLKHLCQSHFMVLICTDVEGFYDLRAAVMHRSELSCCFGPEMHQSASQSDQLDSPKKNVQIVQKVSFFYLWETDLLS